MGRFSDEFCRVNDAAVPVVGSVLPLLQAVAPYSVEPIVRPSSLNPAEIKKLLDFGAQTILVPFVQNAAEAKKAVASVTYPPNGIRGVSGVTRATRFGRAPAYQTKARDEICLIVQVETRSALDENRVCRRHRCDFCRTFRPRCVTGFSRPS